jgi:general secretion pathway protein D
VTLDKENAAGINWSKFQLPKVGPSWLNTALSSTSSFTSPDQASGSVSVGAVTSGKLNTTSLLSFLSTQGLVQTISSPQMTFVSGSSATLKVGGQQTYISQVGQLVGTSNTSGTTNASASSGVGTNTVSTSTINTGLNVDIAGTYENDVVFANMNIELTGVTSLNPTTNNGVTIDLPITTDEKINTVIRVRPGDNLVLAGLVTSSDNKSRQGVPFGSDTSLTTYGDNKYQNHELVIVVKPSVILFSDKMAVAEAKKKSENKPLPEQAVLIDKDGTQAVAMPAAATLPSPYVPQQPPIPLSPYDNGAVVDQRLMQRGFSHAFDELLQPAPSAINAQNGAAP